MLEEILAHLRNDFARESFEGSWTIENGSIELPFLASGQYFRIEGSIFNDGIHQYPDEDLADESFEGRIFALAVPKQVQDLAEEIAAWRAKNPETAYASESFGGYSYSKATQAGGAPVSWQAVFRSRLNRWRKL